MKKKVILSVIAFAISLFFSLLIFVPYAQIATKIINSQIQKNNINVTYDTLNIGLFGAEVTDLQSKDIVIDKITLSYNPIGLIFKRVSFKAESDLFNVEGKLSGSNLKANVVASVAGIAKSYNFNGGGRVNANIEYNIDKKEGNVKLDSGNIAFKHPLMNIEADSLTGLAKVKNNIITIEQAKITGKTNLDAQGTITINPSNINFSLLNISGKVGLMGMNLNFKLGGNFASPQFSTTQ